MEKAKEYLLVTAEGINNFNKTINEHIKLGWTPIGGASVYTYHNIIQHGEHGIGEVYSQALVKY
jgi:hypothetical protein